jgi:hypothetical protein
VFHLLGSNLNPILTQLARTRRAVFVEGKDFQIIGKFAQKLKNTKVSVRNDFAVIPVGGFNPERIRSLKDGIEATLGGKVLAAAILDRDFRSDVECKRIASDAKSFCDVVVIHNRKEIENFLLVPTAIDRAAAKRVEDNSVRSGKTTQYKCDAVQILEHFAIEKKEYVTAQYVGARRRFERTVNPSAHETAVTEAALREFGQIWQTFAARMSIVPGKDALSAINQQLQQIHGVSLTPTAIIDAMKLDEVPTEIQGLIQSIDQFATKTHEE